MRSSIKKLPSLLMLTVLMAAAGLYGSVHFIGSARAEDAKPAAAGGPVPFSAMNGINVDGLTDAQKALVLSILNENGCDCSCGMKLAVCRRDDAKCTRSLALSNQVIDLVKAGKSREEIVKTALTPPSKFVQFPVSAGDAPSIGPKDAKVTMLAFLDYQCPFCSRIEPTLQQLLSDYPTQLRIVYMMHPLSMHPNAMIAAQGAMAANEQGKFKEMNTKLFANQQQLSRDNIIAWAKEMGLNIDKFTKDLDSPALKARIDAEAKQAEDIGATGTPASFVNGRYVSGAKQAPYFKDIIDEELKWAQAGNRPDFKMGKNVSEASAAPSGAAAQAGPDPNKVYTLATGKAPSAGPAGAKVTIVHFFDYQCPYCVRVHPTLDQVLKDYPKDVRIVYMMHPLPFHPQAGPAAEAALSAQDQGKFFEMHEQLMANSGKLTREKLIELATQLKLDVAKFTKDLDTNAHKVEIDRQTKEAMQLGATGTPAQFINGRYLPGAQPYDGFKKLIDEELAKMKTARLGN